jgi:hypothetical protein
LGEEIMRRSSFYSSKFIVQISSFFDLASLL